jgi:hypothetical protein
VLRLVPCHVAAVTLFSMVGSTTGVTMAHPPPAADTALTVTMTDDTADGACHSDCPLPKPSMAASDRDGTTVIVPADTFVLTASRGEPSTVTFSNEESQ